MIDYDYRAQSAIRQKNSHLNDSLRFQNMKVRIAEKNLTKVQMKKRRYLQIKSNVNNYLTTIQNLSSEISCQAENCVLRQLSALKIQKFYRGYLVRKAYEEEIFNLLKTKVKRQTESTVENAFDNFFSLGRKVEWAKNVLTRFFKRLAFVLKIRRIEKTYYVLKVEKRIKAEDLIKKSLSCFIFHDLISTIKYKQSYECRLSQIRKNLALITIKNYFKSTKLTFRQLKRRIKIYKRKHNSLFLNIDYSNDKTSTRAQSAYYSENYSISSHTNSKYFDDLNYIQECGSLASGTLLNYDIEKSDNIINLVACIGNKLYLPVLSQKDSHFGSLRIPSTQWTSASISRARESIPIRSVPPTANRNLPRLYSTQNKKRPKFIVWDPKDPPKFTHPTASSLSEPCNFDYEPTATQKIICIRENTTLFTPTVATLNKMKKLKYTRKINCQRPSKNQFVDNKIGKNQKDQLYINTLHINPTKR
ncbi:hypothetical protein SteCoe_6610 [Stentor coeruleus]|uniref:Uncharacterized protein n=1 Tax=Stentor coeruleus TaxID=5963 RepID=A0A1R2CPM6_9CILI|nr:hypothetical protein SteCoe_6610 [Stentor coeruleus]